MKKATELECKIANCLSGFEIEVGRGGDAWDTKKEFEVYKKRYNKALVKYTKQLVKIMTGKA